MKPLLLDENMPRSLVRELLRRGFEAAEVYEEGLQSRPDEEILNLCRTKNRILLTADVEFGNILRFPLGSYPGIFLVRLDPLSGEPHNRIVGQTLERFKNLDIAGWLVVIEPNRERIQRPPSKQ